MGPAPGQLQGGLRKREKSPSAAGGAQGRPDGRDEAGQERRTKLPFCRGDGYWPKDGAPIVMDALYSEQDRGGERFIGLPPTRPSQKAGRWRGGKTALGSSHASAPSLAHELRSRVYNGVGFPIVAGCLDRRSLGRGRKSPLAAAIGPGASVAARLMAGVRVTAKSGR